MVFLLEAACARATACNLVGIRQWPVAQTDEGKETWAAILGWSRYVGAI